MVQLAAGLLLPASLGSTISVFGITLATASGLTIAGNLVNLAVGALAQSALLPRPSLPKPADLQQNFRSAIAPRLVHLGRVKVGGQFASVREGDGKIFQLIVQGWRQIDGQEEYFIDGNQVTLDAGGFVTEDLYQNAGSSNVQILTRLGAISSTYYPEIQAQFSDWTVNHRLDGLVTSLVIADSPPASKFTSMFPNRAPSYQSVFRGIPLYDPRNGLTQWSENPALAMRDYLANADGLNTVQIDDVSFAQAADDCDDPLATQGGADARYRVGGSYRLTDSAGVVTDSISNACDGELYFTNEGKFGFRVGKSISPTVFLEKKHLVAVLEWSNGQSSLNAFTTVKPDYTDQELGYVTQSIDPWRDDDLIVRYGRESVNDGFGLEMVPTHHQARRLSKIFVKKQNPAFTGKLRYNLHGLKAFGESFVNIDVGLADFGIDYSGPVKIDKISLAGSDDGDGASVSYVDIEFRVIPVDTYDWTLAEEGAKPINPIPDSSDGIPDPQDFFAIGHGMGGAGIAAAWFITSTALTPVLEYSNAGADTWQSVTLSAGEERAQITGLTNGQLYDLRFAWASPNDSLGDYAVIQDVQANADTGAPSSPSLFSVTDQGSGQAGISITASASVDNYRTNVYRDAILAASIVSAPGASLVVLDGPGVGSYTYTAESENVSGDISTSISTTPAVTVIT